MAEPPDDGRPRRPGDPGSGPGPGSVHGSETGPASGAGPDSGSGRRRRQADATRRLLLAAAGDVFAASGYQGTTVRAITTRARTAHGTFYLYFENKEDVFCRLIETVIVDELAVGTHTFLDAGPDRDRLAGAVGTFAADYARHVGLWRALLEGVLQSRAIRDLWLELRRRTVLLLADEMRAQHGRGLVRSLDPLPAAHALTSMTEWFAFTHLALDEPSSGDGRRGVDLVVETLTDLWLHAVYGRIAGASPS
jgi:AcrR family transcriptional regulator